MSFTAQNQSAHALFERSCYRIPRNQRKYVWTKRNWKELWDDVILVNCGKEKTHFIGSIVLYRKEERENGISHYTIIDGQQRIITLQILLSSIAFWLKCYSAENEFNGTKRYIIAQDDSDRNHVMVTSEFHLSLERVLMSIATTPLESIKNQDIAAFVDSNILSNKDKNIAAAFKYFLMEVSDGLEKSRKKPVNYLIGLRDVIVNKILYVSIIASSEEDACTIFEILNARGSALEDHELLKNYIMRGIKPEGEIDQAKTLWNEIESDLGNNIGRFVKHYATHRYRTSDASGLGDYKTIQLANKGLSTKELLDDIKLKAQYYRKLINPICDGENANCSEIEYKVYSFFKRHRQEQIRPILLSLIHQNALNKFSNEKYEATILFLYDFFICYTIIGQENSNKITNTIYSFAKDLEDNFSEGVLQKLVYSLCDKLPSLETFQSAFSMLGWSHHGGYYDDDKNKERVRIVLEVLERQKSAKGRCDEFTIEHILDDKDSPQNGKIGNLIPLESGLNERCQEKKLAEKIEIYKDSSFCLARGFAQRYQGKDFVQNTIDARAKVMAKDIYEKILGFKINQKTKRIESTRYQSKPRNTAPKSKTIGEIVSGTTKSVIDQASKEKYEQISMFDDAN